MSLHGYLKGACALVTGLLTALPALAGEPEARSARVTKIVSPNWLPGNGARFRSIFIPSHMLPSGTSGDRACSAISYVNKVVSLCCKTDGECQRSKPNQMYGEVTDAARIESPTLGFQIAITGSDPQGKWVDFISLPDLNTQRRWRHTCDHPSFVKFSDEADDVGLLCSEGTNHNQRLIMRSLPNGEVRWTQLLDAYSNSSISTLELDPTPGSEILLVKSGQPSRILDSSDGSEKTTGAGWENAPELSSATAYWPNSATAEFYITGLGNNVTRFTVPGFSELWSTPRSTAQHVDLIQRAHDNALLVVASDLGSASADLFDANTGAPEGTLFAFADDGLATAVSDLDGDGFQEIRPKVIPCGISR